MPTAVNRISTVFATSQLAMVMCKSINKTPLSNSRGWYRVVSQKTWVLEKLAGSWNHESICDRFQSLVFGWFFVSESWIFLSVHFAVLQSLEYHDSIPLLILPVWFLFFDIGCCHGCFSGNDYLPPPPPYEPPSQPTPEQHFTQ